MHATYSICRCHAITTKGTRCRALALADPRLGTREKFCALHLPDRPDGTPDPRRTAAVESNRRRTKEYWRRWHAARTLAGNAGDIAQAGA